MALGRGREMRAGNGRSAKGRSLFSLVAIRVYFAGATVLVLCQPVWFCLPSLPRSPLVFVGVLPAWSRWDWIRLDVQHRAAGRRGEICAQREIINK